MPSQANQLKSTIGPELDSASQLSDHISLQVHNCTVKHSHLPCTCLKVICLDIYPLKIQCCEPFLTLQWKNSFTLS